MASTSENSECTRRQIQADDCSGDGSAAGPPCIAENMLASPGGMFGGAPPCCPGRPDIPGIPPAPPPIICCSIAIMGSCAPSGASAPGGKKPGWLPSKAKGDGRRGWDVGWKWCCDMSISSGSGVAVPEAAGVNCDGAGAGLTETPLAVEWADMVGRSRRGRGRASAIFVHANCSLGLHRDKHTWDILLELAERLRGSALKRRDLLETGGSALRSEALPPETCLGLCRSLARQGARRRRRCG
jgi:hypothetical protein